MGIDQFLPGFEPQKNQNYSEVNAQKNINKLPPKNVTEIEPEDVFRGESLYDLREKVIKCPACNQLGYYVRCAEHKHIPF